MFIRHIAAAVALMALVASPAFAQSQPADQKANTVLDNFGNPAIDHFGNRIQRDPSMLNK